MDTLQYDVLPGLKVAAALTYEAVDSLPLPVLIVLFLACLGMLYLIPGSKPLLPLFTQPTISEKSATIPPPQSYRPSAYLYLDPRTNQLIPVVPTPPVDPSSAPEHTSSPGRSRRKSGFRCSLRAVEEEPEVAVFVEV